MSAGAGLQQPIPRDWDISLGQPQHPPHPVLRVCVGRMEPFLPLLGTGLLSFAG